MSDPAFSPAVQLRRATPEDSDVCGRICFEAFTTINKQHNFPPELPEPETGTGFLKISRAALLECQCPPNQFQIRGRARNGPEANLR